MITLSPCNQISATNRPWHGRLCASRHSLPWLLYIPSLFPPYAAAPCL